MSSRVFLPGLGAELRRGAAGPGSPGKGIKIDDRGTRLYDALVVGAGAGERREETSHCRAGDLGLPWRGARQDTPPLHRRASW